jgi:lysophospholipase L1-like esterase
MRVVPEDVRRPGSRRALLEVKHRTPATMVATAAVLLSTDRDGQPWRGVAARRLSGVARVRVQCAGHAEHWRRLATEAQAGAGPLWVVLGDSSAQAVGAVHPEDGYVGLVRAALSGAGQPWRVLNLSSAGALTRDVLADQLPRLDLLLRAGHRPDLVSCGVGANDVLRTPPHRLRRELAGVAAGLPAGSLLLTLTAGLRGHGARYLGWLNTGIRAAAVAYGHSVADVEREFGPPWAGKFSPDGFHPSALGYTDWATAVLRALDLPGRASRSA